MHAGNIRTETFLQLYCILFGKDPEEVTLDHGSAFLSNCSKIS